MIQYWRLMVPAVVLPFATGCTAMQVTRIKHFPSKPENCELRFDYGSPMEAMKWMAEYDQVGMIGAASRGQIADEWTDSLKDMVRADACRLGSDVVVMMGGSSSTGGSSAAYFLYRKLETAPPASATAPAGTVKL